METTPPAATPAAPKAERRFPAADLLAEREALGRGWHLMVRHRREAGQPLYHVRSSVGTTLDLVATLDEARRRAAHERGSVILAIASSGQASRVR